jgi:uncharacterized protein (TIGR02145 family)
MKKLSVAMLAVFVLAVLTNAAPGGKKGNSKEIAEIIGPVFGSYVMLQDAYFLDAEKIGSFNYIGFVIPRDVPYVEFGESESPKGLFVTVKNTIGKCSAGRKISITPYTENGGRVLKYKCASDAGCESLFPNLKYLCEQENNLDAPVTGFMRDPRDGRGYSTVQVGGREWMSENLNYRVMGSRCLLDKNANCEKYGRLYSWNAAKEACPTGWHLPSLEEWVGLFLDAGANQENMGPKNEFLGIAKKIKSKNGWKQNASGTNDLGFSVLPGGAFLASRNMFAEDKAAFWSSRVISEGRIVSIFFDDDDDASTSIADNDVSLSIRCVKDE